MNVCQPSKVFILSCAVCVAAFAVGPVRAGGVDAAFVRQTDKAMAKMMAAMDGEPSGNVDMDFVATMVPHHRGAIEMSEAELRYGRNEQLRRIAQEIIVTQQEEIAAMRFAAKQRLAHSLPAPAESPGR